MLSMIEVRGEDAGEFLHRVTAGTVRGLAVGQGAGGALFNGQSRVLGQFDLLRLGEHRYRLAAPAATAAALAEALEALHFSERLEVVATGATASALPGTGSGPARAAVFGATEERWPSPVPGFDFSLSASGVPGGWDLARIGALVPWPASEWKAGETPALEAGMLPVIDRHKGCYPGQEVVELSLNVGHPARVLIAVEGAGEPAAWEGATVTSAARGNGKWRAIVRVSWAKRQNTPPGISLLASHW
jgi:folate-binding protein YgfZ